MWRQVRDRFRAAGLDTPDLDARLLAQKAFGLDALSLMSREKQPASTEASEKLAAFAARRLRGEPVVRILGQKEFWGLNFVLNAETLVPRPETEMLVRRGAALFAGRPAIRILDLGTGSGAIAIALLTELAGARAVAVDLSSEAILAAQWNAERHGVGPRFETRQGSWFAPVGAEERFDLIVSNPPYVERAQIQTLRPEVKEHDPRLALDGGWDGLEAYRAIAPQAAIQLAPGGAAVLEIGAGQGAAVSHICLKAGFSAVSVEPDLAGLDRMIVATHLTKI